jgi:hypothetical protein
VWKGLLTEQPIDPRGTGGLFNRTQGSDRPETANVIVEPGFALASLMATRKVPTEPSSARLVTVNVFWARAGVIAESAPNTMRRKRGISFLVTVQSRTSVTDSREILT